MLTEIEILDSHDVLGVTYGQSHTNTYREVSADLVKILSALNEAQETRVRELLEKYQSVRYKSGRLTKDYEDDPARNRNVLKHSLANVIGFDVNGYYTSDRFTLGRG